MSDAPLMSNLILLGACIFAACLISDLESITVTTPLSSSASSSGGAFSTLSSASALPLTTQAVNQSNETQTEHIEYPPYDGWYNNYAHPEWGAADTALLRLLPPAYGDGAYAPSGSKRANPLEVARAVFDGPTGRPSFRNRTALLVFFGQQMVEEILDAQGSGCPPEYFNIPIPKGHPLFDPAGHGGREIPLLRTRYDARTGNSPNVPREQLNEVTPYFDGNLMYGPNKAWTDSLRLFKDGLLAATNDSTDPGAVDKDRNFPAINDIRLPFANPPPPRDHVLKPVRRFYKIGNPRGNENPFLLTFGILWFRYHNFRARQLKHNHPNWDDEKLFNEARKWVIAVHQKIVYFDWLKAWLGETLPAYSGYDPHVHPQIAHVFQSAAMRFGHTLVPPGVFRRDANCNFRTTTNATKFAGHRGLRTCNSFWNPQEAIRESDIDEFLMGMASQIAEREDHIVTPDLHGHVFGTLDFSRRDLMAVNIQRGRDHGLPDYNTAREYFGLPRIDNIDDLMANFTGNRTELKRLYPNMHDVDIWPAGMLETSERGPGDLFRAVIKNQFQRIRSADRFWFENYKKNKLFTEEEFNEIKNITIRDVILAVTNIPGHALQQNPFFHVAGDPCEQPVQLNPLDGHMEDCTRVQSFDYFSGSEAPYILTLVFILGSIAPFIGILLCAAAWHKKATHTERSKQHLSKKRSQPVDNSVQNVPAVEWIGHKQGSRAVVLVLNETQRRITVMENRKLVRTIDLSHVDRSQTVGVVLSVDPDMKMMLLRFPKDYDLVLVCENGTERETVLGKVRSFLQAIQVGCGSSESQSEKAIKLMAVTKLKRQKTLDKFFSGVFAQALKYDETLLRQTMTGRDASLYVSCELTKYEFAEALGLEPESKFVENMFIIVDKNNNGYISFREFLDFFVIFSKGTADDKAKLLFSMYDLGGSGTLSKENFKMMLRSMVELGNEKIEENKIDELVNSLFQRAGLESKKEITFDDFNRMLRDYRDDLNVMSLDVQFGANKVTTAGQRDNLQARARKTLLMDANDPPADVSATAKLRYTTYADVRVIEKTRPKTKGDIYMQAFLSFVENYRRQIFWVSLYTLVLFGIFIERAYYYAVEREASGLRRICGYGVAITRGAASAMMFTYASMLVTMCRNVITYLRDTFLHAYVPFDEAVAMHKYIGFWSAFFTLVHIIGHCFNMYHIASQTPNDLACLFRNYFHPTDALPKFTKWCWTTITGLTGVALTLQFFIILVFSVEYARRHTFKGFWAVHMTYPLFFVLMILHGAGRMIQAPYTYYFVLGPIILFTIDQLVSVSRRKIEIPVVRAKILPSDVTYLEMKKPLNFEYKSGQWVRIACLERGKNEYHPITLTSAPHEENLMVHIRAVGPWTYGIRRLYDPRLITDGKLPKVFIDGPYGEGHQDWHRFDVSILIGGGIGVTPFASILKDIGEKSQSGAKFTCKKVYFIWVTKTQRHFEWLTEIIRKVEDKDRKNLVTTHIFITEFRDRFDIRTTMLYICEKYFQKVSERSLFTGLRSPTHFGRPDFSQFFQMVKAVHPETSVFGVFTCGPLPLIQAVDKACAHDNKYTDNVLFVHHHENI